MNKKSQSGSAHLIIVIVLAAALVGALGFIYWQNFIKKDNDTSEQKPKDTINKAPEKVVVLSETASENVTGEGLTVNYPATWKSSTTTRLNPDQTSLNTTIKITSPSGGVVVNLWSNVSGIGGVCGVEPGDSYTITALDTYVLGQYSGYSLYSGKTLSKSNNGSTRNGFFSGVLKNSDTVKVGESGCNTSMMFFHSSNDILNGLTITINSLIGDESPSLDKINTAMTSDEYKVAVKIVQSLHKQ